MDKKGWKRKIKKACEDAGTYQPYYEAVVDTLAEIMENRDKVMEQYLTVGRGNPVINHTNKGGNTNLVKSPFLVMACDLNAQALAYWKELGLTARAYKQLGADAVKKEGDGSFEKLLAKVL